MYIHVHSCNDTIETTVMTGYIELSSDDVGHFYVQLDSTLSGPAQVVVAIQGYDERDSYDVEFIAELDRGFLRVEQVQALLRSPDRVPKAVDFVDDDVLAMARAVADLPIVSDNLDQVWYRKIGVKPTSRH